MTCPYCQGEKFKVTKTFRRTGRIIRYRLCLRCKKSFPTVEFVSLRISRAPMARSIITATLHLMP
jgi:transcriptional regulator NrdR family protein